MQAKLVIVVGFLLAALLRHKASAQPAPSPAAPSGGGLPPVDAGFHVEGSSFAVQGTADSNGNVTTTDQSVGWFDQLQAKVNGALGDGLDGQQASGSATSSGVTAPQSNIANPWAWL